MPLNPTTGQYEHWNPELEGQIKAAQRGKEQMKDFAVEQATDPLNYIGAGSGMFGKALGKAAVAGLSLIKADDANAIVYGRPANEAIKLFEDTYKAMKASGLDDKTATRAAFGKSGVYRNSKNQWMGYISDAGAKWNSPVFDNFSNEVLSGKRSTTESIPLGEVLNHPELYNQFPSLSSTDVRTLAPKITDSQGRTIVTDPGTRGMFWDDALYIKPKEKNVFQPNQASSPYGIGMHELQHKVQSMTGKQGGGSPEMFDPNVYTDIASVNQRNQQIFKELLPFVKSPKEAQPELLANLYDQVEKLVVSVPFSKRLQPRDYQNIVNQYRGVIDPGKLALYINQRRKLELESQALKTRKKEAETKYLRLHGEAEARMTQNNLHRNLQAEGAIPQNLMVTDVLSIDPSLSGLDDPFLY